MPPMMPTGRTRRPSRPISAQDLLEGGWVAYQHPEGEGYPVPYEVRDIIAAARALDPERMDRRTLYLNLTEQREHQHRTGHNSRPRAPRRESFATAPKVERLPQVERRRRQLRRVALRNLALLLIGASLLAARCWLDYRDNVIDREIARRDALLKAERDGIGGAR